MAANERVTVAFDALGSERGPEAVIEGVRAAAADGIGVRAFGDPAALGDLRGVDGVEVIDSPEAITNRDDPVAAVRGRPRASIVVAAEDVSAGRSAALVSHGATGATMAAAVFTIKRLRAVQRPALAVQLPAPARERPVLLLDAGASAEARPQHLVQYAFLGSAFAASTLAIEAPRVALLSVGEERGKGTPLVKEAHTALEGAERIDFIGNVEGRDLLGDLADVVVTDGFTGNVALKSIEGAARAVGDGVARAARSGPLAGLGGLLLRPALGGLRRDLDPDSTGGAILLGLRGVTVVGHGSAGPRGITNSIRLAARAVSERAVERTAELLAASGAGRAMLRDDSRFT